MVKLIHKQILGDPINKFKLKIIEGLWILQCTDSFCPSNMDLIVCAIAFKEDRKDLLYFVLGYIQYHM